MMDAEKCQMPKLKCQIKSQAQMSNIFGFWILVIDLKFGF
jgi:hypothetical protein